MSNLVRNNTTLAMWSEAGALLTPGRLAIEVDQEHADQICLLTGVMASGPSSSTQIGPDVVFSPVSGVVEYILIPDGVTALSMTYVADPMGTGALAIAHIIRHDAVAKQRFGVTGSVFIEATVSDAGAVTLGVPVKTKNTVPATDGKQYFALRATTSTALDVVTVKFYEE